MFVVQCTVIGVFAIYTSRENPASEVTRKGIRSVGQVTEKEEAFHITSIISQR
jgi:hypothetical protein